MALSAIWCCTLQRHVPCVTNREGDVVSVVCFERQADARTCRAKTRALQDGVIGDLLRPDGKLASLCTLG